MRSRVSILFAWSLGLVAGLVVAIAAKGRFDLNLNHQVTLTLDLPLKTKTTKP